MSEPDKSQAELLNEVAAQRLFVTYLTASVVAALVEKQSVDAQRIFSFNKVFAAGFDGNAVRNPEQAAMWSAAAGLMRDFEPTFRNLVEKPAGAGRG